MKVVLKDLTKIFKARGKSKGTVTAVDNVSLEIPDGTLVCLLGPSGCGKSTILNMICGLEVPTSGQVFFGEDDVTKLPPESRQVGMVFQNYALYPHLDVYHNIIFPLENLKGDRKMTKEQMRSKAMEAAKLVQIEEYMERKPGELSGGQQQRVSIARALVKTPRVLLLDEPLSNLDARLRLQTREEIRRIQRETGVTTIFVTHDQEEAMSISDLIIVMESGKVRQIGKPREVYDNPANLFVAKFLGTPAINIFEGNVAGGKLLCGGDILLDMPGCPDGNVIIGIRPEGFVPDPEGPFKCIFDRIEVMGRDTSVLARHTDAGKETAFRGIINDYDRALGDKPQNDTVAFSIRPGKMFVFAPDGGRLL